MHPGTCCQSFRSFPRIRSTAVDEGVCIVSARNHGRTRTLESRIRNHVKIFSMSVERTDDESGNRTSYWFICLVVVPCRVGGTSLSILHEQRLLCCFLLGRLAAGQLASITMHPSQSKRLRHKIHDAPKTLWEINNENRRYINQTLSNPPPAGVPVFRIVLTVLVWGRGVCVGHASVLAALHPGFSELDSGGLRDGVGGRSGAGSLHER